MDFYCISGIFSGFSGILGFFPDFWDFWDFFRIFGIFYGFLGFYRFFMDFQGLAIPKIRRFPLDFESLVLILQVLSQLLCHHYHHWYVWPVYF